MILNMKDRQLRRLEGDQGIDDLDFSDITTATRTGPAQWVDAEQLEIPLSQEPTPEQAQAILNRITSENANEELLLSRAKALYTDLRTIRDSTGNLSSANLSNAVRVLARGEIAIMRLLLRDLDSIE